MVDTNDFFKNVRVKDLMDRKGSAKRNITSGMLGQRPASDPILSKLVKDTYTGFDSQHTAQGEDVKPFSADYVGNAVWNTAGSAADAKNLLENLPDLELVIQILVSSIISPNDVMNNDIIYKTNDKLLGSTADKLLQVIQEYFKDDYKLDDELPEIVRRALATTGSYPYLVLPENSIDDIINSNSRVTTESFKPLFDATGKLLSIGILGDSSQLGVNENASDHLRRISVENFTPSKGAKDDALIREESMFKFSVTDNINALKIDRLISKATTETIDLMYERNLLKRKVKPSLESWDDVPRGTPNDYQFDKNASDPLAGQYANNLIPDRQFQSKTTLAVKTQAELTRKTQGHPLTIVLPSEAVIPVIKPSDPTDHVGYFIVNDATGNPLRMPTDSKFFSHLQMRFGTQTDMTKYLADKVNRNTNGDDMNTNPLTFDDAVLVYKDIIERNLNRRLLNGVVGHTAKLAGNSEIYSLMLARAYQGLGTQFVFVPKSLMTYFAYDYNDYGIGRSILEKSKMIGSLRSALLYGNVMTGLKNSITRRVIDITLDPKDPAPEKTVELLLHHAGYATRGETPFGHLDPNDIVTSLQNSGIMTKIKGHPGYPEVDVDVDFRQNNYTRIDTELDEMLKKWHHMMFGLTPETVELSMGQDLATSVISNNVFHSKRVKILQDRTNAQLPEFIKSYTYNSSVLMDRLVEIIKANKETIADSEIVKRYTPIEIAKYFITTLETDLPEPDTAMFEMQQAALEGYEKALEKFLPSFISETMFTSTIVGTKVAEQINVIVEITKAYFLRRYMKANNIMPELFEMIEKNADGKGGLINLLAEHRQHANNMMDTVGGLLTNIIPIALATDKKLEDENIEKVSQGSMGGGMGMGTSEAGWGDDTLTPTSDPVDEVTDLGGSGNSLDTLDTPKNDPNSDGFDFK